MHIASTPYVLVPSRAQTLEHAAEAGCDGKLRVTDYERLASIRGPPDVRDCLVRYEGAALECLVNELTPERPGAADQA